MIVIFLDFDGVITTAESISEAFRRRRAGEIPGDDWTKHQIDPELVQNVRKLQDRLGAKIVISSTWRILDPLENLKLWLGERGIDPETIIDVTPHRNDGSRGREIKDWLDEHPEVTGFKILDDDGDVLDVPEFKEHWIHTSFARGFDDRKLQQVMGD